MIKRCNCEDFPCCGHGADYDDNYYDCHILPPADFDRFDDWYDYDE